MPKGYRHLTFDGRCRIYATGKGGLSNGAIARRPGRDPSTISRELRRDGGGRGEAGEGWSPERVPGRLRLEDPGMVGGQRIYDLVRADRRDGGTLCGHLRRRGKKRTRQGGRHAGRGSNPGPAGHPGAPGDRRQEGEDR